MPAHRMPATPRTSSRGRGRKAAAAAMAARHQRISLLFLIAAARLSAAAQAPAAAASAGAAPAQPQGAAAKLLPLTYNTQDYLYSATLGIGTPATPFRLAVDTGSANLWVPSSSCTSQQCGQGRQRYNPSASRTAKVLGGRPVSLTYGLGDKTVTGVLATDRVTLPAGSSGGGGGDGSFAAGAGFMQTIMMATKISAPDHSDGGELPWDGVLGMGRQALAEGGVAPPVLSMVQQGVISRPVFGIYTIQDASAPGAGGELALGGWNEARLGGELTWVNVVDPDSPTQQGFWSVPVDALRLSFPNGTAATPSGACGATQGSAPCVGMLDSGTAQLLGSIDQVAALNRGLGGRPTQQLQDCEQQVDAVLEATTEALNGPAPALAANAVCGRMYPDGSSLGARLCAAVQLKLFDATGGVAPTPAMLDQAQEDSLPLCEQLPYTVNVAIDCSKVDDLPSVEFVIGGKAFAVPPQSYAFQSPSDLKCYSGAASLGSLAPGSWLLGDFFLRNFYTVYDFGAAAKGGNSSGGGGKGGGARVGIGPLGQAEREAAQALFERSVEGKGQQAVSAGARGGGGAGVVLLAGLAAALSVALSGGGWLAA